jgi:addiction module HigA family antidote
MRMHSPPHPGSIVKFDCLEPLELSVTEAAKWLGVTRPSLSHVVNCQAAISPTMALRLEAAGWGVAEGWLRMQVAHDLWKAKKLFAKAIKVKPFPQRIPEPA